MDHHSYVTGGHSNYEYFGPQNTLNNTLSENTTETCNSYNMLKLARHLFAVEPKASIMDYYERTLYNHILASIDPNSGMTTYFTSLRMGGRNLFFHIGDLNLGIRREGESQWTFHTTARERKKVADLPPSSDRVLMAADITATLGEVPLRVVRRWETDNGDLVLSFRIDNPTRRAIEIGSLGIPLPFNNNMDWKDLDRAHAENVFFDPYIGRDAGYLQVNRLHGNGASLLILPHINGGFEAYNPLNTDPTPRSITFEGFHEWMVHSKALADGLGRYVIPASVKKIRLKCP